MIVQRIVTEEGDNTRIEEREVSEEQYRNYVGAVGFFRRLGGSERVTRDTRGRIVKIVSRSPDKSIRKIATWEFKS